MITTSSSLLHSSSTTPAITSTSQSIHIIQSNNNNNNNYNNNSSSNNSSGHNSSSRPNKRRRKRGISNTKLLEQTQTFSGKGAPTIQERHHKQPSIIRGKQPAAISSSLLASPPSSSIKSSTVSRVVPSTNINQTSTVATSGKTSSCINSILESNNKRHLQQYSSSTAVPPRLQIARDQTDALAQQSLSIHSNKKNNRTLMPDKKRGSLVLTCSSGGEEDDTTPNYGCTASINKEMHIHTIMDMKAVNSDSGVLERRDNSGNTLMPQPSSTTSPISETSSSEEVVITFNSVCNLNTTTAPLNVCTSTTQDTTRSRSNSKTIALSIKIEDTGSNNSNMASFNHSSSTTNAEPSIVVTPPMTEMSTTTVHKSSTGILSRLLAVKKRAVLINSTESPTQEPPTRSRWKKHARSQSMSRSSNVALSCESTNVSTCGNSSSYVSSFSSSKSFGNSLSREHFSSSRSCSEFDSHSPTNSHYQCDQSPQHHTNYHDFPSSSQQSKKSISVRGKSPKQKMTEVQASCHLTSPHHDAMFSSNRGTTLVEGDDGLDGGVIPSTTTTTTSPRSTTTSSTTHTARNYKNVFLNMVDDHISSFLKKNSFRNNNRSSIMNDMNISQTSSRKLTLADCPPEILLYIASFVLSTINCCDYPTEKSSSPVGIIVGSAFNFSTSSLSPSGFMFESSSNISSRSGRHSSTLKRFEYYPKYTMFPKELTRDYFSMMLSCKTFYCALNYDPEIKNDMKNGLVEGFWEYILFWHYVYPNFASIDKMDDFMTDLRLRKPPELSYKRIYQYVNTQVQQIKVQIPKKKNSFDPTNYFYLLVAGVNSLVIQTIRALFYESKWYQF